MNGPDCPIHKTPMDWVSTFNEWEYKCPTCDLRYNKKMQAACPYCYEPCQHGWCGRCERALPRPKLHHMKHDDSTACGAEMERGNSYYEWAYVDCPACLDTRPK